MIVQQSGFLNMDQRERGIGHTHKLSRTCDDSSDSTNRTTGQEVEIFYESMAKKRFRYLMGCVSHLCFLDAEH